MKKLLKDSIAKAITYQEYNLIVAQLVTERRTSGLEQSQEKIDFTKLNASRGKRLDKTAFLSPEQIERFNSVATDQIWLTVTESWCGDAAQTVPFLNKIAEASSKISLKILFRDENEALMNAFLTNGTKSILKLIVLDPQYNVLASWGSRSETASKLVHAYKIKHGKLDDRFKQALQIWYNKNQGHSLLNDLIALTSKASDSVKNSNKIEITS